MSHTNNSSFITKMLKPYLEALIRQCFCLKHFLFVHSPIPNFQKWNGDTSFREKILILSNSARTLVLAPFQQHRYFPEENWWAPGCIHFLSLPK